MQSGAIMGADVSRLLHLQSAGPPPPAALHGGEVHARKAREQGASLEASAGLKADNNLETVLKRKDDEIQQLEIQVAAAKRLAEHLQESQLAGQVIAVFSDLLDSLLVDVATEFHRAARLGLDSRLLSAEEAEYSGPEPDPAAVGAESGPTVENPAAASKHSGKDVFGQTHPAVASDTFDCLNCGRQVVAGRYAPHLEKCMGKGRNSSRVASRALANQRNNNRSSPAPSGGTPPNSSFTPGGADYLVGEQAFSGEGLEVLGGQSSEESDDDTKDSSYGVRQRRKRRPAKRPQAGAGGGSRAAGASGGGGGGRSSGLAAGGGPPPRPPSAFNAQAKRLSASPELHGWNGEAKKRRARTSVERGALVGGADEPSRGSPIDDILLPAPAVALAPASSRELTWERKY